MEAWWMVLIGPQRTNPVRFDAEQKNQPGGSSMDGRLNIIAMKLSLDGRIGMVEQGSFQRKPQLPAMF